MSRLEHLRKPLQDMTPDELREKIRFIREDRRLSKVADKAPKAKREKKAKDLSALIANMTPEQKRQLLKDLGG